MFEQHITAYAVVDDPPPLRKASREREWMDATRHRFAYRCLPLVIANQAGWDILNTVPFRARWNGGDLCTDVRIENLEDTVVNRPALASAHFGYGVLTFDTGYLFRTPPGTGLLVCGPVNAPRDGIDALCGIVETDWSHATFTMNYRFTRPMHWVHFARDEPICRIIPVDRHLLDSFDAEIRPITDEPELAKSFKDWMDKRTNFNNKLKNPFSPEAQQGWQRDYFRGQAPSGEKISDHQTQLHHSEFIDRRQGAEVVRPSQVSARTIARKNAPPDTRRADASEYLWNNSELYDRRREKSATILAGIFKLLASNRPLGGREDRFLTAFDRIRQLSAKEFTWVWNEPTAFHWTRVAFELIDSELNGASLSTATESYLADRRETDPSVALARHLDEFRLFELGAAIAFGNAVHWDCPLVVDPPRALPGTRWTFSGEGPLALLGFDNGILQIEVEGERRSLALQSGRVDGTGASLQECDVVSCGVAQIRLQPEMMAGLGLAEARSSICSTMQFRSAAMNVIDSALQTLNHFDGGSWRLLGKECRVIAPKPPGGDYSNTTFSTLPGAMVLSITPNALEMADRVVHELHHDRLFCIEEFHSLLEVGTSDDSGVERFYSPWRLDPRPVRGILHGMYVYIALGRFWLNVFNTDASARDDRQFAAQRLRTTLGQLSAAAETLVTSARFTPFGSGVFEQLCEDVEALRRGLAIAGVPADPQALTVNDDGRIGEHMSLLTGRPLSVREALDEHRVLAERLRAGE